MTDFMLHAIAAVLWLVALMSAAAYGGLWGQKPERTDGVIIFCFSASLVSAAMAFVLQVIA